ncbi:OmpA family protein [Polaromonas sp. SM01]|uniref:OmpA family protein n=1 Tax=Polaromonas sp. SM01 TaxID=3085630 RepID=UPI002981665E|nr:OmpA family protein [Polaromonas sp. SM01]MDW5443778.1 OmpA family protein [Polaromonas sp. SM01]
MASPSDDDQQRIALGLVFAIVALVVAAVIGTAVGHRGGSAAKSVAAAPVPAVPALGVVVDAAVGSAPLSAQAAADAASITVEYGVVKFYFASGKADLALGASEALVDVVKGAQGGKKVIISGFHDAKGNAQLNADLARQRAFAVRDALKAAGVAESQITLEKPAQTAGSGSDAEARRVEITLQ